MMALLYLPLIYFTAALMYVFRRAGWPSTGSTRPWPTGASASGRPPPMRPTKRRTGAADSARISSDSGR